MNKADEDEQQDLRRPIIDPILLLVEGSVRLPASSNDVAPLDSLDEFDKVCTIDVRSKLSERERAQLEKNASLNRRAPDAHGGGGDGDDDETQGTEGGANRKRKQKQTVLTRINEQWSSGPTAVLHRALTNRLRVKVWVRNHSTVRSILTGFVAAFDKHLNLALVDVDEVVLLRPATIKCATLMPAEDLAKIEPSSNEQLFLGTANSTPPADAVNTTLRCPSSTPSALEAADTADRCGAAEDAEGASEPHKAPSEDANLLRISDIADSSMETNLDEQSNTKDGDNSSTISNKNTTETRPRPFSKPKPSQKRRRQRQALSVTSESQRFVAQLFVRGENVVMVAFADTNTAVENDNNNTTSRVIISSYTSGDNSSCNNKG